MESRLGDLARKQIFPRNLLTLCKGIYILLHERKIMNNNTDSNAVRTVLPYGPDVVFAPPAFKGQQSAKGATRARFAMIAARLGRGSK